MAYPFVQMPTFGEFLRIAQDEYGCEYRVDELRLVGPDGASMASVLTRLDGTRERKAVLPRMANEDRLTPHVLQSLCVRLNIPVERFGFTLSTDNETADLPVRPN